MMVSFVLSFFPRGVLDEILNLIESVSEGFPSYSYNICRVFVILSFLVFVFSRGVISSFREALFHLFVFCHSVISSFRLFAWRLFPAKDEKTPCKKTTRRNNAKQNDGKTKRRHAKRRKDKKTLREKTTKLKFQMVSFRMVFVCLFVFARGGFRLFAWHYFVFSLGVFSSCRFERLKHVLIMN